MDYGSPLLAFAWTFVLALAVGVLVNRVMWKRAIWPRAACIALGLALARAVMVTFEPRWHFEVLIVAILLGAGISLANRFFPGGRTCP